MKSKFFHLVCLMTIMAFAISCGKDEGGSGGHYSSNLVVENNGDTNTVNAINKFKQWYNSKNEPGGITAGIHHIIERAGNTNSNNNTTCLIEIGSFCLLYGSTGSGTSNGNACWVLPTANNSNSVKPSNPILKGLYDGSLGTVVTANANMTNDLRGTFVITLRNKDNKYIRYTINTNYHSILQPLLTERLSDGIYSQYIRAYPSYTITNIDPCF